MEDVRELVLPDWMTLAEAAEYLMVSDQAAGRAAIRHGFDRCRIGNVILLSRDAVVRYAATRLLSGPRKHRPSP